MAEFASYLSAMKTLLLFIGTVLRSRIIQRKGLRALPAIYKLIRYWWSWTPLSVDSMLMSLGTPREDQATTASKAKQAA
jgi:hypothetical protein